MSDPFVRLTVFLVRMFCQAKPGKAVRAPNERPSISAGYVHKLECRTAEHIFLGAHPMPNRSSAPHPILVAISAIIFFSTTISPAFAQQRAPRDPAEPQQSQ